MHCPRGGSLLISVAIAGAVTATYGCGRVGFELQGPLDDLVDAAELDSAVTPGDALDAALADAAPQSRSDAGDGAQPEPAECAEGVLICEGFEASLADWRFVRSDGTASITVESRSGKSAVELSTRTAGATAYLERSFGPVSSGALHVRAFVRIDAGMAVNAYDFLVLSNALVSGGVAVSLGDTTLALSGIAGGTTSPGTLPYARDEWSCVELSLPVSQGGDVTVSLGGLRDTALLPVPGVPAGGYARIALGIVRSPSAQVPTRISIDDVVVSTQPIGCN